MQPQISQILEAVPNSNIINDWSQDCVDTFSQRVSLSKDKQSFICWKFVELAGKGRAMFEEINRTKDIQEAIAFLKNDNKQFAALKPNSKRNVYSNHVNIIK